MNKIKSFVKDHELTLTAVKDGVVSAAQIAILAVAVTLVIKGAEAGIGAIKGTIENAG